MGLVIGLGGNAGSGAGSGGGSGAGGGEKIPFMHEQSFVNWSSSQTINNNQIVEFPETDCSACVTFDNLFNGMMLLKSVGKLRNAQNVKSAVTMFGFCYQLEHAPEFDTSNVTSMSSTFSNCYKMIDTPPYNTSKVTNVNGMFNTCEKLVTIGGVLDFISVEQSDNYTFAWCSALENVKISNNGVSLSFDKSNRLTKESVLYLFNNAKTGVSGKTIKFHADVYNQLTTDEVAIATEKGFTVASA